MYKIVKFAAALFTVYLLLFFAVWGDFSDVSDFAGNGDAAFCDGKKYEASFKLPYGIAVMKDGSIIVADSYNNRIRKIYKDEVITVAGSSDEPGYYDGAALKSLFSHPRGVAVDSEGNIFIADSGNNVIRKLTKGKVYTFCGTGQAGMKDGAPDAALFNMPSGIAIDSSDNLYVADTMNNAIRKITKAGRATTLFTNLNEPSDLIVDSSDIYFLDCGSQTLKKITGKTIKILCGISDKHIEGTDYYQGDFSDGKQDRARLNFPKGIAMADSGVIFIADTWNHSIRAFKPDGELITIAGNGVSGRKAGSGINAQFSAPSGIAYRSGKLYISDMLNNNIRVMDVNTNKGEKLIVPLNEFYERMKDEISNMLLMLKQKQ